MGGPTRDQLSERMIPPQEADSSPRASRLMAKNNHQLGRGQKAGARRRCLTGLVRCTFHQHQLHFPDVDGFRGDHAGRIFFQHDGLVFHEGKQFAIEFDTRFLPLHCFGYNFVNGIVPRDGERRDAERRPLCNRMIISPAS